MSEVLSDFFASLEKHTGIALDMSKKYLVDSRLAGIAKDNGFGEISDMLIHLNRTSLGGLHYKVFDAMTTNETMFFRDPHIFESLRGKLIPDLIRSRGKDKSLRFWSAATSSGQEAYSIAIMLCELLPDIHEWDIQIIATDFSERALSKAKEGIFTSFELGRGLDRFLIQKYFSPVEGSTHRQVNKNLRDMVRFSLLNLIDTWPPLPYFDFVFLRNVLIYFSQETKDKVLSKVSRQIGPVDGTLILGASEMIPFSTSFKLIQLEKISYYKVP